MKKRVRIIYASGKMRRIRIHIADQNMAIRCQGIDVDIAQPLLPLVKESPTISIKLHTSSINSPMIEDRRKNHERTIAYPRNLQEWVDKHGSLAMALSHCEDF